MISTIKYKGIIQSVYLLFLAAIFFLPLERIGSFAFGGMNIRISQLLVVLIFIIYIFYSFYKKKFIVDFPVPLLYYVLFLCVCLFSLFFAHNRVRGTMVTAFLIFMIIVPYVTVFVVDKKEKLQKVINVFLSSAVVFSLFGLFQFAGGMIGLPNSITGLSERYDKLVLGFPRIQSTFIEPLYFANYLMIPIMLALFFLIKRIDKKKSWYFVVLFLLFLGVFVLTISKGAIASFGIVALSNLLFQIRSVFNRKNILYLFGIVAFISVVAWGLYSTLQSTTDFEKDYKKAYDILTGGSITERQESSDVAIEAFNNNIILGIGVGNFGPYFAGYPTSAPDYGWSIVNNQYLEILSELGLTGFAIFFIFIFSIFYYSLKAYKRTQDLYLRTTLLALNFAFFGVIIQYLTFSTLYIMHIWILIGLILAIQQIIFKHHKDYIKSQ